MENLLGLLKINVRKGINLAKRDVRSSDPYVILRMGHQGSNLQCLPAGETLIPLMKLKTRVVRNNVNPEWNEELTLSISDPNLPITLQVYDKDTFSLDDKMGDAEFKIHPFLEALKMHLENVPVPCGTIITRIKPDRGNCLSEESSIVWENGEVIQHMFLRLRNVECGEIELKLHWVKIPGSRGL